MMRLHKSAVPDLETLEADIVTLALPVDLTEGIYTCITFSPQQPVVGDFREQRHRTCTNSRWRAVPLPQEAYGLEPVTHYRNELL